jgi:lipopolysaccharide transport system ATP-binding protein
MPDIVIAVENLSKRYLIGHQIPHGDRWSTLRDVIAREARGFTRKAIDALRGRQIVQGDEVEEFWALRNVSFEVKQGEILGIIGRNGAGKSTLLKILSRITDPTEGRVTLRGRVASLLEVGTGFHAELTGRENIFLNGAILGMTQKEIRKKFDDIVEFAEVERFIDTPVKHYSSGMYIRLAFAVAAHLEPEILIVDEVLAVGDAEFQKKCLGKMHEVSQHDGRTVLFVSHNMGAVSRLCPTAIWLDAGCVRRQADARDVIGEYLVHGVASLNQVIDLSSVSRGTASDDRLRLESLEWLCQLPLRHGEPVRARIHFKIQTAVEDVTIGIGFSNIDGRRLLTYETDFQDGFRPCFPKTGRYWVDVEIDSLPLAPDMYSLDVGCRSGDFHGLDYVPASAQLEIISGPTTPGTIIRKDAGVRLPSKWTWNPGANTPSADKSGTAVTRNHDLGPNAVCDQRARAESASPPRALDR